MKKNYFLMLCSLLLGVTMQAQLGTTNFTLGNDISNNYSGSWVSTSAGTGFGDWTFSDNNNGSTIFAGKFISGAHQTGVDVNGNSFGMYANPSGASSTASRDLPQAMQEGDVFQVVVGVAFRNGQKGFRLRDSSDSAIITFEVASDEYHLNGNDLYSNAYAENTVITFTFTQNASDVSWTAVRSGGLTASDSGTISSVNAGTINDVEFFIANTDGGGSSQNNLYFNSLNFTSKYTVNSSTNVTSNTTAPYLTIESGGSVTIDSSVGLTVSGNLSNSGTITTNSGASLIVNGTSTGNITYNMNVNDMNWHLMSSPLEGEGYDTSWVDANLIDNTTRTTGTNVGIATYDNTTDADGDWVYATDGSSGPFNTGQGYSIKRDATGSDIAFIGTLKTNDASIAITASDVGGANENRWTLIGNPFSSYIDINALLTNAGNQSALEDNREAIYVWNGSSYQALTNGYIHPGQGFFVNSNTASESISITQAMLSHQTSVTFYKTSNPDVSVDLMVFDGNQTKSTKINYLSDKTGGLDPRFDVGTFTGTSISFNLFTRLVEDDNGVDFMRQAVSQDYENMVIPVGVKVATGKEITFTADAMNLPEGIKVFLEDRENNSFNELTSTNNYKVTVNNALNGTGRFFLHTRSSALSTDDISLTGVGIYAVNKNTLRISGVNSSDASVKVYNILGRKVVDQNFSSKSVYDVSLPNLNTGVYIVQLSTEKGKISKKIVLE